MEPTNSTDKRFDEDIEPFPEVPGVPKGDEYRKNWGIVVDHLMKKEEDRCRVWRDEVENLTIYAGLFSAVVTAFIIESSKSLQDNPSDILLSRIAVALEHSTNITGNASTGPNAVSSSITSANKVINALWFMSLVLSLSSALIGLVGLQWIREHLRPSTRNIPLKTLPAIVQMQADSLDAYYVPQTFTALPLLLIISIALFFVGLMQYLWTINHTVAYPSIITISFVLTFILYTTIRPGMQGLPTITSPRFLQRNTKSTPTIPCPYRSPQSWSFLQAVLFIYAITPFVRSHLQSSANTSQTHSATKTMKNWIDWALEWPRIRDIDQLRLNGNQPLLQSFCNTKLVFPPIYDTVRALTQVKQDFSLMGSNDWEKAMTNALRAFNDFLDFAQGSQGFATQLTGYVHDLLDEPHLPLALPRNLFSQASLERQGAHSKMLFQTAGITNLNDLQTSSSARVSASIPDLLRLTCENFGTTIDPLKPSGSPIAILWYRAARGYFGNGEKNENMDFDRVKQLIGIVNLTIEHASMRDVEYETGTLGTSSYVKTLLHAIANIIVDRASTTTYSFHNEIMELNDGILTNIESYVQNQTSPNTYLFLLSSIYAHFLLVKVSPLFETNPVYAPTKAYGKVAGILKRQHTELCENSQLRKYQEWIFPRSLEVDFTWAYLDPKYEQGDEDGEEDGSEGEDESIYKDEEDEEDLDGPEDGPSMPSRSNSRVTGVVTDQGSSNNNRQAASAVGDDVEKQHTKAIGSMNSGKPMAKGSARGNDEHAEGIQLGNNGIVAPNLSGGLPLAVSAFVPGDVFVTLGSAGTEVDRHPDFDHSLSSIQPTCTVPITDVDPEGREDPSVIESIGGPNRGDAVVEMGTDTTSGFDNSTILGLDSDFTTDFACFTP